MFALRSLQARQSELQRAMETAATQEKSLADELQRAYPTAQQQGNQRRLGSRWSVTYGQSTSFSLNLEQGLRYLVSPLPSENTP